MYEIKMHRGRCQHDTIAKFTDYNYEYTSVEGLSKLLDLAKGEVATPQFATVIGCHGDAWIPAKDVKRSFGGAEIESRIDISTLRDALKKSNLTAEYILFDDCYMSSVEVAYELREVCRHLIASPAEAIFARSALLMSTSWVVRIITTSYPRDSRISCSFWETSRLS